MKIGILQLARYGDIILCWPLIRALKRNYPGAEVTMIVRESYAEALDGLDAVDKVVTLQSRNILEPLWSEFFDVTAATERVETFLDCIEAQNFDWLINLSFSPLSAEICSFFEGKCKISGYSRYPDESLRIHGKMAQYFFDQVGVERWNRLHLLQIFSRMLHLELIPEDFSQGALQSSHNGDMKLPQNYFTIHLGGSEGHKVLHESFVAEFLNHFLQTDSRDVVFLGSQAESQRALDILERLLPQLKARVYNLAGKTKIQNLFEILTHADFHLGGDSLPLQISLLTQTPTVLLSFDGTRFWETGPLVRGSLVLKYPTNKDLVAEDVSESIRCWVNGTQITSPHVFVSLGYFDATPSGAFAQQWDEWVWQDLFQDLLNELYFDSSEKGYIYLNDIPIIKDGLEQFSLLHSTILDSIESGAKTAEQQRDLADLAARVDELSRKIGEYHPVLAGVARWAEGEKSQIQPGTFAQILSQSKKVYSHIRKKIDMMRMNGSILQSRVNAQFDQEGL